MSRPKNVKKYAAEFRQDICTNCVVREPCFQHEGICDDYIACEDCEIRERCKRTCLMLKGYLNRGITFWTKERWEDKVYFDYDEIEKQTTPIIDEVPKIRKITVRENGKVYTKEITIGTKNRFPWAFKDIPWNVIGKSTSEKIKKHFIENMTYDDIAKEYNTDNPNVYRAIQRGLNKIKVAFKMKEFFHKRKEKIPKKEKLYMESFLIKHKTIEEITTEYNISDKTFWTILNRFKIRFNEYEQNEK